jgi:hypothetical protein
MGDLTRLHATCAVTDLAAHIERKARLSVCQMLRARNDSDEEILEMLRMLGLVDRA